MHILEPYPDLVSYTPAMGKVTSNVCFNGSPGDSPTQAEKHSDIISSGPCGVQRNPTEGTPFVLHLLP